MDEVENYLLDYCKDQNIEPVAFILHGSQAIGFANDNSDVDILIISDDETKISMDALLHKKLGKIHIEFMTFKACEKSLANFEGKLFNVIFDLNITEGRLFMGQVMLDSEERIRNLFNQYKPYQQKENLIRKFYYQANNFYSDSKTSDKVLKRYCLNKVAESIGVALLISNDITVLNLKWQHRFLEKILPEKDFAHYLDLKFYNEEGTEAEIKSKINSLVQLIKV